MQRHTVYVPPPCAGCGDVVFVADGAGNFHETSDALRKAIAQKGAPVGVETVEWSHGPLRVISDQTGYRYAREQGHVLAEQLAAWRAACPKAHIHLLSHSAGATVVLTAAAEAPPGTVDEIVVLSPSISRDYDLRPALRNINGHIDTYSSEEDWLALGLGIAVIGTADRRWAPAAGRVGFRPTIEAPEDAALYCKLRMHPWHPVVAWTGNNGGHSDSYRVSYLSAYVVPLFVSGT
jgi:pimeloyl-ACP methyl ester carboxylesterase